jgi:hypothetical protein
MTIVHIAPGDGSTDVAAAINAALADPAVTRVVLGAGTFMLNTPIVVPSGKTLEGAGRELTILKPSAGFARAQGEYDGVVNTVWNASGVTLSDFSVDADSLKPGGFRLHGVFMRGTTDFSISRVDVHNSTGYAHFAQGDVSARKTYASGTYDDCLTTNSQIHYEQMFADGITLTNVHAREGLGTLNGTFFHPVYSSRNITYIDSSAYGAVSVGVEITADGIRPTENIHFINTHVEVTLGNPALVAAGSRAITGLLIQGSTFISHHQAAVILQQTTGTIIDSYIQGEAMALIIWRGTSSSSVAVIDSHIVALRDPAYNGAAYALGGDATTIVQGGTIEAYSGYGPAFASGTSTTTISPTTIVKTGGYASVGAYTENGAAVWAAPALAFTGLAADQGGNTLIVSLLTAMAATDRLDLANRGEVAVSGGEVLFGGVSVGAASGGIGTAPLTIAFSAGATAEAVAAVAGAVTYLSVSETLVPSRASSASGLRIRPAICSPSG